MRYDYVETHGAVSDFRTVETPDLWELTFAAGRLGKRGKDVMVWLERARSVGDYITVWNADKTRCLQVTVIT